MVTRRRNDARTLPTHIVLPLRDSIHRFRAEMAGAIELKDMIEQLVASFFDAVSDWNLASATATEEIRFLTVTFAANGSCNEAAFKRAATNLYNDLLQRVGSLNALDDRGVFMHVYQQLLNDDVILGHYDFYT